MTFISIYVRLLFGIAAAMDLLKAKLLSSKVMIWRPVIKSSMLYLVWSISILPVCPYWEKCGADQTYNDADARVTLV